MSNIALSDDLKGTGSWVLAMANALIEKDEIELYNIALGTVHEPTRQDFRSISQWVLPRESLKNGLPGRKTIKFIQKIVESIDPEIIHVWGTEDYWGLLSARGYIKGNVILDIQGLKFTIEKYFYSGLSFNDILGCYGPKEFLMPSRFLIGLKYSFRRWGGFEKEILKNHKIISTQSNWIRAHVKDINPSAHLLKTTPLLRNDFLEAKQWDAGNCIPGRIFTTTSSSDSYKGLHILLEAVVLLKKRYFDLVLVIAGPRMHGLREGGYSKWLRRKIRKLDLEQNVVWAGPLNAKEIIQQMHDANLVVIPSFVESFCVALEEALTVGVPTVVSFSGAMPELASHEKTALFFSPGDAIMCANACERFLEEKEFAKAVSNNAFNFKRAINKNAGIAEMQLSIYRQSISST